MTPLQCLGNIWNGTLKKKSPTDILKKNSMNDSQKEELITANFEFLIRFFHIVLP